ncbi:hypothetical protein DBR40_25070 [Pedobacter sp. KBW01]|nr:hypothetical protein DBR40_25070 [Pedobacter sp. KBW01]
MLEKRGPNLLVYAAELKLGKIQIEKRRIQSQTFEILNTSAAAIDRSFQFDKFVINPKQKK